jgi:hypothetical protein
MSFADGLSKVAASLRLLKKLAIFFHSSIYRRWFGPSLSFKYGF